MQEEEAEEEEEVVQSRSSAGSQATPCLEHVPHVHVLVLDALVPNLGGRLRGSLCPIRACTHLICLGVHLGVLRHQQARAYTRRLLSSI